MSMNPPTVRDRPAYYAALQQQTNLAVAFRHAGMCRIFKDNDPLARVYRALNILGLRYLLSAFPTHRVHAFLPLPQRERLLICRFRALLSEYAKHGFALDRFDVVTTEKLPHRIQDIFVTALAHPLEHGRPRWKRRCRKALRVVEKGALPDRKKVPVLFHRHAAKGAKLTGNQSPKRRQFTEGKAKHVGDHASPSTTSTRHSKP